MNSMTPSPYRRVLQVAGALIAVDLDDATEHFRHAFDDAWADAVVPCESDADTTVNAGTDTGPGLGSLADDIVEAAVAVLRGRDVWVIRAALLIDGDRGALLVPTGDEAESTWASMRGPHSLLAPTLMSIDPHGKVSTYRAPARAAGTGGLDLVPPSVLDGVTTVPASLRLSGVVLLERSETPGAERLGLEDSLGALTDRLGISWGSRAPLRSLARLIAALGGVVQCSPVESGEIVDVIASLGAEASATLGSRGLEEAAQEKFANSAHSDSRVYRAGAIDALVTDAGHVIVLLPAHATMRTKALLGDHAEIWTRACGVSREVLLSGSLASPAALRAYAELDDHGLLDSEPSWSIADAVVWADDAETTVVFDLKSPEATPLVFDRSARSVWQVLVRQTVVSRLDVVRSIAAEYGVTIDVVTKDVDDLLERLRMEGLVTQL